MSGILNHEELILRVGTNQMELLEFWIEKEIDKGGHYKGIYGINVSKVLEVVNFSPLTEVPHAPPCVMGILTLRGESIPIVSLAEWLKIEEGEREKTRDKIIVAEFNNTRMGFLVQHTNRIRRIDWEDIKVPPDLMNERHDGCITGVTLLEGDQTLLILDFEKIVSELMPRKEDSFRLPQSGEIRDNSNKRILVADDSLVARKQVMQVLKKGNFQVEMAINGKEAWKCMEEFYEMAEEKGVPIREIVYLVITDVEMPVMDGYTFTRRMKDDPRFNEIPIIMHSSLSGQANQRKGQQAGCDVYVTKFDPKTLFETVCKH